MHEELYPPPTDAPVGPDSLAGEVIEDDAGGAWEWLPPPAAALRLGVSERTLWRMIKAGRYHRRTERGRAEVRVPLPDSGARNGHSEYATTDGATPDSGASPGALVPAAPDTVALSMIEALRQRLDVDEERLTRQADELRALVAEHAALKAERDGARAELRRERRRSWWQRVWGIYPEDRSTEHGRTV